MNNLLHYKGFHGSVSYSAEDECLFGKIEFIKDLITFEAEDVAQIRPAFQRAVDDYLAHCERTGTQPDVPYKGSFNVRVSPQTHRLAAIEAKRRGVSLNELVSQAIDALLAGRAAPHSAHETA
ncbi:Uncharacterized protein encoded in hypervariable junctions of pilus gene clusters [Bordetella ansorpii]|uniref:Uncharacterized protein encoded in hypervariable junctions of pilus gene clusters n=1 Tax=Bordetella ansorpii TaxID=288768 RepID=A0A157LA65_9BORD|nr:type II toxin-antitoxin system HicB family antitoxin [Bordetella ansorpii]SAH93494.1 Uncharacterized protein encoded in hypervariable junctions of pilus gene clusters [Bordetella ansorpii]